MKKEQYTKFLDELREDGYVNMYGAVPFLQNEFCLDKKEARAVLAEWMAEYK